MGGVSTWLREEGRKETNESVDKTDDLAGRDVLGEEDGVDGVRTAVSPDEQVPSLVLEAKEKRQWEKFLEEVKENAPLR